jgi:hypothetical protein
MPASKKGDRIKYGLVVFNDGKYHFVGRDYELVGIEGATIEDEHFHVPVKERPLWWHSMKGAQRVGERIAKERGWGRVKAVEIRLPDAVGSRIRYPSRYAGPERA